jgi:membrane-associated phospholipid phosphatase
VLAAAGLVAAGAGISRADEVTHWNNVLLGLYRLDFGTGCPCPLARAGAITQVAVFDAVNSIDRRAAPYIGIFAPSGPASKEAAVAAAAHRTMVRLFPNSAEDLDAEYATRLALIPDGPAKANGIAVGEAAANACVDSRLDDGADEPENYVFGGHPGDYRPTPPGFNPECNPEWTHVRPFCMVHGDQYRLDGPLGYSVMTSLLESTGYAAQVNAVKTLGSLDSTIRTDEQTRIAFFWANDLNGTYKPPGHLFSITQVVSADHALSLSQNARLFALVGLAMGDAGIAAWDMKYATDIDLWRPISAIRLADTDGNPQTSADSEWEPLNPFTPPFPSWISGHATFGAAHAGVMAEFFGTDSVTFTVDSEDPYYNALPVHGPRTFHSFSEAAVENGLSRVYLGVHFPFDASDGNATGFALGHMVGQTFLRPACRADWNLDGIANSADFFDFLNGYFAGATDFNDDGEVNSQDFFDYLTAFFAGC